VKTVSHFNFENKRVLKEKRERRVFEYNVGIVV